MFDWTSFLELAEELAKREGEAELRSSISRAYYAVFHTSRHLAEELGLQVPNDASAHGSLWKRLEAKGKGRRKIAQNGKRLRIWRNKADYDDDGSRESFRKDARSTLELARQTIELATKDMPSRG